MSRNDDGHLGAGGAGSDAPPPKRARLGAPPSADPPSRAEELRARLPHLAAEQYSAERARILELIALAEREVLSLAEEVLAIPYLSERSVMSFLRQGGALSLRTASRACRDAVAEHAWSDWSHEPWFPGTSCIKGSLASWRSCFPRATAANVHERSDLTDADFVHLRGMCKLEMWGCGLVTDAGLEYLSGIRTLNMSGCTLITDAGLSHLSGIHTLYMRYCELVTDTGLAHLSGIHTLYITDCAQLTDAGLAHLVGIRELQAFGCPLLTAAGLAQLRNGGAVVRP